MSESDGQRSGGNSGREALAFFGSLLILCGLMYYTYTYPYPSGRPPSWGSFAVFWLREIVILLFALLVVLIIAAGWVRRVLQQVWGKA